MDLAVLSSPVLRGFTGHFRQSWRSWYQGRQGEDLNKRHRLNVCWTVTRFCSYDHFFLDFREIEVQRETKDILEIQVCLETLESQVEKGTRG